MSSWQLWSAVATASLALACSDVRLPDDDGPHAGAGGEGGGTSDQVAARLFAAGWLGVDADEGIRIWNNPDSEGIQRDANFTIPMSGVEGIAVSGDIVFVYKPPQLLVYENGWAMDSGSQPGRVIEVSGTPHPQLLHRMRTVPELDLLAIDSLVFKGLATINSNSIPVAAPWFDPVYDAARDRLFVVSDAQSVAVLDAASTRDSYEPDWVLYSTNSSIFGLASDGTDLFTSRHHFEVNPSDFHVLGWPIDIASASTASIEYANVAQVTELVALTPGGVLAAAQGEIRSWPKGGSTGNFAAEGMNWHSATISKGGRVYAADGFELAAFASAALTEPAMATGGRCVALIER